MCEYIGKYVCFDRGDGAACWGRIVGEGVVNTQKGERDVFILEDRYIRYKGASSKKDHRRNYGSDGTSWVAATMDDGSLREVNDFQIVSRPGRTNIRKEAIDLENDIVDVDDLLSEVDNDILFKAVLKNKQGVDGKTALEIGIRALAKSDSVSDVLKARLREEKEAVQ